jgi:hypothetical protein
LTPINEADRDTSFHGVFAFFKSFLFPSFTILLLFLSSPHESPDDPSRSGIMSGSLFREKKSRHLVLWSLGIVIGLLEILRQGIGCIKGMPNLK